MSTRSIAPVLIAALLAVLCWQPGRDASSQRLHAEPAPRDQDTDDDFLPDDLEWVCLTNALSPDTDLDGVSDFVEVVQRGNPRHPSQPVPTDHEMRLVVTSRPGVDDGQVVMHLLFRFLGTTELLTQLDCYAEVGSLPGLRVPLSTLSMQPIAMEQRMHPNEGLFVRLSISLVSETVLRSVLPCAISAHATIGGRTLHTVVPMFDHAGATCSVVGFAPGTYAIQTVGPNLVRTMPNNRVCVLQLQPAGSSPGGSAFVVTAADCQDCNDLTCGTECSASLGSILVLPGGVGSITGG